MTIELFPLFGRFAEDKELARTLRRSKILPALQNGEDVILDFAGIGFATQSFIHALVFEALYKLGESILDRVEFRSCAPPVRTIVEIVIEYTLNPPVTGHSPVYKEY